MSNIKTRKIENILFYGKIHRLFSQYTSRIIVSNQELTLSLLKSVQNIDLLENEKNLILYFCFLFFVPWNLVNLISIIL